MIETKDLVKKYGEIEALKGINLAIGKGEIFGLLGPNGAGKTTLISILSGYIRPTSGDGFIEGRSVIASKEEVKKIIGVVPQEISLYSSLTGEENLKFFGRMYGVNGRELKSRIEGVLDFVGLKERKDDIVKNYSGGMKRRLNLACGIINAPKYLFLDEPTVGVDPQTREHIFKNVELLKYEGVTVLYTTHYMEEAERLCDRIAIIDEGNLIAQGSLDELLSGTDVTDLEALFLKLTGKELRD
ncbi:MAG: ABC transporter [Candidatus Schekmanbacteria bacterium RIFCSPHIGHO2_02_FULL_38_11]|uniref:ABC transporter n=1 Tax=Candidatus Schekmanbacteria bacterium RIFCSPLOWO2_12_FULL_38_15 TaxID=1817883 RepID=A0A1F7SIU5_9BACT|nr:MAG: ABC transporter [Candidatus Schekmanbacteria bacterium GWA2_38_9]OGL48938.1 MAG: ABC transporter [Candidatus Schekmanbacteria bacterium RIFCSPLOWO2_02_FULL_38_14]OGL50402.1 MAG: ABC transporter [Candidatus Schekmanbacteria bacterium RIFCSPHIGHO2_02_FULL_38_11]OGL53134.1 MAG: ABC transporter [Candidatus Schekmanbacteria bacterium RIFCSPLOWO2_12_FULL_38_15]